MSELVRDESELEQYHALPPSLRPRRIHTHALKHVDQYVAYLVEVIAFCRARGLSALPMSPQSALAYLRYARETEGRGVPAVLQRACAINCWHYSNDLALPESRELFLYKRALHKEHTPLKATPADTEQVIAMCRRASLRLINRATRDIALIWFVFITGVRPGQARLLRFEDLYFAERGFIAVFPKFKFRQKPLEVEVCYGRDPARCPVTALLRWLELANITSGYVFRGVDHWDNIKDGSHAINRRTICGIVQHYGGSIHMGGKLGAYTLRRGLATTLAANDASAEQIQRRLGHEHVETTRGYIDDVPVPFERSISALVLP